MRTVDLYFDFISPYAYLALHGARTFEEENGLRFRLRPVVYAALLDHHGLSGPVETEARREYTFHDIVRCAELAGAPLEGPPAHPFKSLAALRVATLFAEEARHLELVVALASACWAEGRDLSDMSVLGDVVTKLGLDSADLESRISTESVKGQLRDATEQAISKGIFGVPTCVHEGELFWGHDRLPHLRARLNGTLRQDESLASRMLARPSVVQRPR